MKKNIVRRIPHGNGEHGHQEEQAHQYIVTLKDGRSKLVWANDEKHAVRKVKDMFGVSVQK